MRLSLLFIFSLTAWVLTGQEDNFVCKEHLLLHASHADQALGARTSPYTNNYDLKYNRLEWDIDPNQYYIKGIVTTYFTPKEANMENIFFDLSSDLQVNNVSYHGQSIGFSQQNNLLEITFPQAISEGILDSVSVDYEGAPPSSGFGSFGQAFHSNAPAIWTLSEPYGGRDWWPCKVDLGDKLDSIDVYITTPQGYRAASNGVLQSELTDGDHITYHWKHRHPITGYLVALAVTNYAQYSDFVPVPGGDPIEVLNYVYPENLSQAQSSTNSTVQAMQLYNELYGLYPFANEKYGHAQFSWGGGMEHQTMSFMGGWSHSLQAHELAHQWFGDKVTCGSWQDIWLNEGFATYSEGMNYENNIGPNTWPNWLNGKRNQVTGQPDGSVWVPDTNSVNRIFSSRLTYSKGALVLHMLRWKVGSDNFFQGVRNYNSAPGIAYNYARTADLQAHLEDQSGLDLDEFFEDWFYGQGYPSYQLQWGYNAQQQLRIQINQTTSHASVDFFEMPVPVQFSGQGQDTILVFDHTFSGQVFEANLPFTVEQVTFDPELWILSANNSITVGVNDLGPANQALYLYPNPASSQLRFDWSEEGIQVQTISISDVSGKVMIHASEVPQNQEINIEALPAGYYFLQLATNKGLAVKSFVKQ